MAIVIDLQNDAGFADAPALPEFERWVMAALQESHGRLEQTICVVDETQSRELNHRFRGKDSATNVLAFPGDNDFLDYDCLGDLVICAPLVALEAQQQGKPQGPEGSLGKLAASNVARAAARVHTMITGTDAMLTGPDSPAQGIIAEILVSVPSISIAGGTDEIQRNIISERVLGMDKEPRFDSGPFRDVRRN